MVGSGDGDKAGDGGDEVDHGGSGDGDDGDGDATAMARIWEGYRLRRLEVQSGGKG